MTSTPTDAIPTPYEIPQEALDLRLAEVTVAIPDRPGALADLFADARDVGVHDRTHHQRIVGDREIAEAHDALQVTFVVGVHDVQVVREIRGRDALLQLMASFADVRPGISLVSTCCCSGSSAWPKSLERSGSSCPVCCGFTLS